MKLRFLENPHFSGGKPSPDCWACHNGCCGTNKNKAKIDEELNSIVDTILESPTLNLR